ncbi:hypothetical protein BOTNAR_0186g00060 [Botryotinia narcissicola]|uniref:Uncharacterized protein n=1 Tax=Botryotinia narcissicola TaxID=278944 RepID=A0A4Z1INA1_9HELO|nr:hypothetical protein BOTNAR_0186g00060 [Botryotinia narcissicola]
MFSILNHTPEVDGGTIQGKDNKMVERCRLISTQEVLSLQSRRKLSQEYARIEEIAETLEFGVKKCIYLQGCKRAQGFVELMIVYANEANEAKGPGHRPSKHTTYQLRAAIGLNFVDEVKGPRRPHRICHHNVHSHEDTIYWRSICMNFGMK